MIRHRPLEQGDRLTREEFERRYEAMPELKKAELIQGVVYLPSPTGIDSHGEPHFHLANCESHRRKRTTETRRTPRRLTKHQILG
jgi:hypothetical protein